MAIFKKNSVGRRLFINGNTDLTLISNLTLTVRRADCSQISKSGAEITIGAADIDVTDSNGDTVKWLSNTYCYISWLANDLPVIGLYKCELSGQFASGQDYSDVFTFKVEQTLS